MAKTVHAAPRARAQPLQSAGAGETSTIRVVSARTGLTMETLRAWERRYGFPNPQRRSGSNRRLYSSSDIERLVAVRRAIEHGYRVGDVIAKTGSELDDLTARSPPNPTRVVAQGSSPPRARRWGRERGAPAPAPAAADVKALIELLARDQIALLEEQLRRSAVALGARRFLVELAHPLVVSVGQAWADGQLSVRHEHLATECMVTQLRQMLALYQDIAARPLVLLATLPGEPHTLALQMVALYLVVAGAKPRLLGGPTPAAAIVESARALQADAVGLTVTPTSDRAATRRAVKALRRELNSDVPLWIGGAGATALGVEDERTRVVTSWAAIDHAVAACRSRPRHAGSAP